jgi:hypothetical protein
VDAPDGGSHETADGDGNVVVEDLGDLGQGGDVEVVECVDAPKDVLAGPAAQARSVAQLLLSRWVETLKPRWSLEIWSAVAASSKAWR